MFLLESWRHDWHLRGSCRWWSRCNGKSGGERNLGRSAWSGARAATGQQPRWGRPIWSTSARTSRFRNVPTAILPTCFNDGTSHWAIAIIVTRTAAGCRRMIRLRRSIHRQRRRPTPNSSSSRPPGADGLRIPARCPIVQLDVCAALLMCAFRGLVQASAASWSWGLLCGRAEGAGGLASADRGQHDEDPTWHKEAARKEEAQVNPKTTTHVRCSCCSPGRILCVVGPRNAKLRDDSGERWTTAGSKERDNDEGSRIVMGQMARTEDSPSGSVQVCSCSFLLLTKDQKLYLAAGH